MQPPESIPRKVSKMSKFVNKINSVPEILTASEKSEKHTKEPSNVITGLGYGGFALVKGAF